MDGLTSIISIWGAGSLISVPIMYKIFGGNPIGLIAAYLWPISYLCLVGRFGYKRLKLTERMVRRRTIKEFQIREDKLIQEEVNKELYQLELEMVSLREDDFESKCAELGE